MASLEIMSIGTFTLIKNEALWIVPHLENVLPHIDQMVFFDGNSTDGTLEVLKAFKAGEYGHKITLVEDMDPADLRESYVNMFNACLASLETDLAFFLHPDMYIKNPELLPSVGQSDAVALSTHIESYAGEPGGELFRWGAGRSSQWKNIFRHRNPNLGAHYHGFYGAQNEDVYFSKITGNSHRHLGADFSGYPYEVRDSGLEIMHFSDVRPYERRLERMIKCLVNQGWSDEEARKHAPSHPRVSLRSKGDFTLTLAEYPESYKETSCPRK